MLFTTLKNVLKPRKMVYSNTIISLDVQLQIEPSSLLHSTLIKILVFRNYSERIFSAIIKLLDRAVHVQICVFVWAPVLQHTHVCAGKVFRKELLVKQNFKQDQGIAQLICERKQKKLLVLVCGPFKEHQRIHIFVFKDEMILQGFCWCIHPL